MLIPIPIIHSPYKFSAWQSLSINTYFCSFAVENCIEIFLKRNFKSVLVLDRSFLTTLGEKFLALLYKTLIEYKNSILIVAEDKGELVGFVSAIMNTG